MEIYLTKLNYKIIKSWEEPYPDCDKNKIRPKKFCVMQLENNKLAFGKIDIDFKFINHEAKILTYLKNCSCVPQLIYSNSSILITEYIEGKLLIEITKTVSFFQQIKIIIQIINSVIQIHKQKIIHSDIRLWNFILGKNNKLYLIDFEYAYSTNECNKLNEILKNHHGDKKLKGKLDDWTDAFYCICCILINSKSKTFSIILYPLFYFIYSLLKKIK
ncbi:hypothetical protein K9M16_04100 [Candidatus Babeliales bacterium]|nr:hypothetical protein [Candidatus Babeliales bacterium]